MIHLALTIIALCIIVPFVIACLMFGAAAVAWLLEDGRWVWLLAVIIGGGLWLAQVIENQNQKSAARLEKNRSLQSQCLSSVQAQMMSLQQEAQSKGTYTQRYADQLDASVQRSISTCRIKYPTY